MKTDGRKWARGIVITPAEAAHEGIDNILDKLQDVGANSVAISPGVFVPSSPVEGVREPPLDIEGEARELDRPLWGSTVQYLTGYSPYDPDRNLWKDVPFEAPQAAPDGLRVDYAALLIDEARHRGMNAFVVTSPTLLPGLPGGQSFSSGSSVNDINDRIIQVDGNTSTRAIAGQGCVNNPRVQALARARLTETLNHYAEATGIFIDWAEYTCYLPKDIFTCFCVHCEQRARTRSLAWPDIRRGVQQLVDDLGSVNEMRLRDLTEAGPTTLVESLLILSGSGVSVRDALTELVKFKADSVAEFFNGAQALAADLGSKVEIGANAFAPPWNQVTGSDFARLSAQVEVVRCKLFTFHWPMMTRWMSEFLLSKNPELSPSAVLGATQAMYQVPTPATEHRKSLDDYRMPAPDEPHPILLSALGEKLAESKSHIASSARLEAYIHSYRPVGEFAALLRSTDRVDGTWIQRYGYLSDRKLEVIRDAWN